MLSRRPLAPARKTSGLHGTQRDLIDGSDRWQWGDARERMGTRLRFARCASGRDFEMFDAGGWLGREEEGKNGMHDTHTMRLRTRASGGIYCTICSGHGSHASYLHDLYIRFLTSASVRI